MARPVRTLGVAILLAFGPLLAVPAAEPAPTAAHVVVLDDGTVVPSQTRPVIAFGKVQFRDASGRLQVLPVSQVDAAATRAHPANERDGSRHGSVSVAGTGNVPASMPVFGPAAPSVTVYSATWCGWCKKTKEWLDERRVSYRTIEVDTLPPEQARTAQEEMKKLVGAVAFPVVVIGQQAIRGYSPTQMASLLAPASRTASRPPPRTRDVRVPVPELDAAGIAQGPPPGR